MKDNHTTHNPDSTRATGTHDGRARADVSADDVLTDRSAPAEAQTDPTIQARPPEARSSQDAVVHHGARAALYGALGAALCYPTDEILGDLADREVQASLRQAGERLGLAEETETFCEAVAATHLEGARTAYNRLFGLPDEDGSYPVTPYEAAYTTTGEGGEEQRRIATVVGLTNAFDLEPADGFHERQDHVAAELELAGVVAAKRAIAAEADASADATDHLRKAERTLLETHLAEFVPAFAHDVRQVAEDPFVAATARLAGALVRRDAAACQEVSSDA